MPDGNSFNTSKSELQGLVQKTNTCAQDLEQSINTMKTTLAMSHGKGAYARMYEQVRERLATDTTNAVNDVEVMKTLLNNTLQQYMNSDASGNKVFAGLEGGGAAPAASGLSSRLNN